MTKALDQALALSKSWIDGLDDSGVAARASLETLRARFSAPLPSKGMKAEQVVEDLASGMQDGLLGSAGGRFYAWVIGGGLEAALAADWLVSTWDQNAALYACGPAASVVEEQAGIWLKELFDLPSDASFAFTTGCQMAHMTSLAAARHAVLDRAGWDVERDGLIGAPELKVLVSDQKHGSIRQAVNFLGLGQRSLVPLETDPSGKVVANQLKSALDAHTGPKIVVLNAADLNIGAFDDFRTLIPIAKEAGAWVHIDGAFGLFARTSAKYAHLADGVELADSWATDGHKWLNVPYDCGIAIIRDKAAHRCSMTIAADYIAPVEAARDQIDWNPEWSRRARGVPVFAALKQLGRTGIEEMVDRCCEHCQAIVQGIGALDDAHIVFEPKLNQGLIRFSKADHTDTEGDLYTQEILSRINATGEAFFSDTIWQGRRAMRVSVVNWRTTERDVVRAINAARHALES